MADTKVRGKEGCLAHVGSRMTTEEWKTLAEFFTQEAITRAEANAGVFDAQEYAFAAIAAFRALGGAEHVPTTWRVYYRAGRGFPLPDPIGRQVDRTMAERERAYELLPQIEAVVHATNRLLREVDWLKRAVKGLGPDTEGE